MLIKLLGGVLIAAAGVIPAIRVGMRERRLLLRTEAFLALVRFAAEQTAAVGETVGSILLKAGTLPVDCGAEERTVGALLTAARENLPSVGAKAVISVFGTTAVTREEQVSRCRAAVAVLEDTVHTRLEELHGNLRTGVVLPLSAAAVALLLLW